MSKVWAHRDIDASADVLWGLLTDLDAWPGWGPTVRSANLRSERFGLAKVAKLEQRR